MKICFDVNISNLKPGMIIGMDVFFDGNLLLSKGTVLKPIHIHHLKLRNISTVTVSADKTYYEDILSNPVDMFYAETYESVASIINHFKDGNQIDMSSIFPVVEKIMEAVFAHKDSILLQAGFKGISEYYYAHSLNVCIYSLIVAKAMAMDYENIVTLGIGALLHDVGKTKIPDSILFKQGILASEEFEEVKRHPMYGFEMVSKIPGIKRNVLKIILQHHERIDRSGYPSQLDGRATHVLSKIVAIADIYDALTSDKVYKKKIPTHEAAEYLLCISNQSIDPDITRIFLQNVAIYPKGCQVLLNNDVIAVVVDSNKNMPLRPLLKVLTDRDKNPISWPYELDLQSNYHTFIVCMLN